MRRASIGFTLVLFVAMAVDPASAQDKPSPADDSKPLHPNKKLIDDLDNLFKNSSSVKSTDGGSIQDRLRNKVQACWAIPVYNQGDILPETQITVNVGKDGSLLSDPVVLKSGKGSLGKQLC